jgi:Zn-dependent protease
MSYKFGDDTAYLLGRVTLNPIAHTDPIGTLLIPIINFIAAGAGVFIPLIGWGKPTPVNPLRWRNKDTANVMVSLAGIMANLLIAAGALVLIKIFQAAGLFSSGEVLAQTGSLIRGTMSENVAEPAAMLLVMALMMNVSLAVFNLLPVPPLDGSKVLYTILPASAQPVLESLEQFGFIILIGLMYFGVVGAIVAPIGGIIFYILTL